MLDAVEALLAEGVRSHHPNHQLRFDRMRVPLRTVSVAACPGETVVVVAEHDGKTLYWSDVEDGWELERPTAEGEIQARGCSQVELARIMWQLFGDPEMMP